MILRRGSEKRKERERERKRGGDGREQKIHSAQDRGERNSISVWGKVWRLRFKSHFQSRQTICDFVTVM